MLTRHWTDFVTFRNSWTAVVKQSAALDRDLSSRRQERERLIARKAQVEQQRAQMEAARARSATLAAELAQSRVERDDFDYLGKVFGPDEIQLCEIRSAGPRFVKSRERHARRLL